MLAALKALFKILGKAIKVAAKIAAKATGKTGKHLGKNTGRAAKLGARALRLGLRGGRLAARLGLGAATGGTSLLAELAARELKQLGKGLAKALFKGDTTDLKQYVQKRWWIIVLLIVNAIIMWLIFFIIISLVACTINFLFNNPLKNAWDLLTGNYRCEDKPNDNNPGKLTLEKTGPAAVPNSTNIQYSISVNYTGPYDVIITDFIADNATYISATGNFTTEKNKAGKITSIKWLLNDNTFGGGDFGGAPPASSNNATSSATTVFQLVVRPDKKDTYVINKATAQVTSPTFSGGGNFAPSNNNNCNGKYNFLKYPEKNPLGNYGDPQCDFTTDGLAAYIVSLDPAHKHEWYDVIIKRETGGSYSPNEYAPGDKGSQQKLDAGGAWGLYQMGSSTPPGQEPPAKGKNGIYDRGDVPWRLQTENAINYNKDLIKNNCDWWYWRSARVGDIPGAKPC